VEDIAKFFKEFIFELQLGIPHSVLRLNLN